MTNKQINKYRYTVDIFKINKQNCPSFLSADVGVKLQTRVLQICLTQNITHNGSSCLRHFCPTLSTVTMATNLLQI